MTDHAHEQVGVGFRASGPADFGLVIDSWLRSYYARTIDRILDAPETNVRVACTVSDPDTILGWICFVGAPETPRRHLHYVYVKDNMRRRGLGSELLRVAFGGLEFTYSLVTERFLKFLAPRFNCKQAKE